MRLPDLLLTSTDLLIYLTMLFFFFTGIADMGTDTDNKQQTTAPATATATTNYGNFYKIVIIGAGPTALGAAYRLNQLSKAFPNISVTILEQRGKPAGLAASERDDKGFLWDMGGHVVFSHYDYFDRALNRAVKNWNRRQRAAYAFMMGSDGKRRFIPYPVQNNIEMMDKVDQLKCLSGLEQIARNPVKEKPANFDQWFFVILALVFATCS